MTIEQLRELSQAADETLTRPTAQRGAGMTAAVLGLIVAEIDTLEEVMPNTRLRRRTTRITTKPRWPFWPSGAYPRNHARPAHKCSPAPIALRDALIRLEAQP